MRRYARTCCRDADTADDLTNEVFAATLQAVRGGAGPDTAVRAYLLTAVRRVAADWARSARREQLVEDFAVFAVTAAGARASEEDTLDLGPDVLAMREAEASLAVQAFRSLPERWQTVLWHTAVEEASPQEVAPLLGLTPNAAAVLAHRAREGLKQAYLQAHVGHVRVDDGGDCARFADRLGAFARGKLRMRAERGLRKHLEECARCRLAASEVKDLNETIRTVLPIAVIGWFAAGSSGKLGALLLGAGGAGASASAAAAAGGVGAAGAKGGGAVAAEGFGSSAKAGAATGVVVVAAAAVLAVALIGGSAEEQPPRASDPPPAAPVMPPAAEEPRRSPSRNPNRSPIPYRTRRHPPRRPRRSPSRSARPRPTPNPRRTRSPSPIPYRSRPPRNPSPSPSRNPNRNPSPSRTPSRTSCVRSPSTCSATAPSRRSGSGRAAGCGSATRCRSAGGRTRTASRSAGAPR